MVFCSKWCSAQSGVLLNLGGVLLKVVFCSESGILVNIPDVALLVVASLRFGELVG